MKRTRAWLSLLALAMAVGCGCEAPQPGAVPTHSFDYDADLGFDAFADDDADVGDDASAYDPPDAGTIDDDASADASGPPFDAGPDGVCTRPLAFGDLVIDELMIASVKGTGDHGEWLEVASTLGCAIDLRGLHAECPRGGSVATVDVVDDVWLPARGTFVIADSNDPAVAHYLPGTVLVWNGNVGDVLRNQGTTLSLLANGTLVDSVTYPALPPTIGATLAFPSDCLASERSDWTRWRTSTSSWFPGFRGTPNAPNSDVACAAGP